MEILNVITKKKLDIGCGDNPRESYLHLDIRPLPHVEYVCDARNIPIEDNSLDGIYSSNTLEHFSWREIENVLKHWASKIKSKGTIELKVPCQKSTSRAYYEGRITAKEFSNATYADQDYVENFHKCAFDPDWLTELLQKVGFEKVRMLEGYYDNYSELTGFLLFGEKI